MDLQQSQMDLEECFLPCTVCRHDIGNEVFSVHRHPVVASLGVCGMCSEDTCKELVELGLLVEGDVAPFDAEERGRPDACSLCTDGGDLMCCGEGSACHHMFCADCISSVMDEGYLP